MTGRALQVVGDRPMKFVAKSFLRHLSHHRAHASELGMAESVLGARLREEFAVGGAHPLRHHDDAVAEPLDAGFHLGEELGARSKAISRETG